MAADLNKSGENSGKCAGASEAELAAILRWYADMGVDLAVGDLPRDHFAEARQKAMAAPIDSPAQVDARGPRIAPRLDREATPQPIRAAAPTATVSTDEAVAAARAAALAATNLEMLKEAFAAFDGCLLKRTATHLVFAEGSGPADLLFVGGVPAAEDDREGRLLAGSSGLLFDRMLKSIGLTRERVHLVNVVPWRPAGGKPPTVPEIATCLPFLQRYVELAAPKIIITLGGLPTQQITGTRDPITRARGKWFEIDVSGSQKLPVIAMFDPDYLRKAPTTKKHAWSDLRALRKALAEKGLV